MIADMNILEFGPNYHKHGSLQAQGWALAGESNRWETR